MIPIEFVEVWFVITVLPQVLLRAIWDVFLYEHERIAVMTWIVENVHIPGMTISYTAEMDGGIIDLRQVQHGPTTPPLW